MAAPTTSTPGDEPVPEAVRGPGERAEGGDADGPPIWREVPKPQSGLRNPAAIRRGAGTTRLSLFPSGA